MPSPRRSDEFLLAKRYYQRNRNTRPVDLAKLFDLSLKSAYRVMEEVDNWHKKLKHPWDVVEEEIAGMDWQYNPERDIRHLPTPKY